MKQQFGGSPELNRELEEAIVDALAAHEAMSTRALESAEVRARLKAILLEHGGLYEALRG